MQLKFFTIPVLSFDSEEDTINKFLRSEKVLEIKREIVLIKDNAYWAISILYLPKLGKEDEKNLSSKERIDYKTILSETEFKLFCVLRKVRKQLADEDAVPAFAVFTDYELSQMSKSGDITPTSLKKISGIGEKKMAKYGEKFCRMYEEATMNEKGGSTD